MNNRLKQTSGFLLTRQLDEQETRQEIIYWFITPEGPSRVIITEPESVFFLSVAEARAAGAALGQARQVQVDLQTFEREPVVACYFRTQRQLALARSRLEQIGIYPREGDLRPPDRYLMERFVTSGASIFGEPEVLPGFLSFVNPRLQPAEVAPDLRVVSLDIETSWNEHLLYSIAVTGRGIEKVFMVGSVDEVADPPGFLELLPNEARVIGRCLDWLGELDPDVIIGWNLVGFDLDFLQMRCDALGIPFRLGRNGEAVRWRQQAGGQAKKFALIPGRVALDGIELLRAATWRFESFSLEFVARALLGKGKLVEDVDMRAVEIQQMYHNNKVLLAHYNKGDCELVAEVFEKTRLTDFAVERSRLTGLELDRAGGSVAAFDFLYLPRLHRQGLVAPVVTDPSQAGGPGGYVLDSAPGLYRHVIVLDFKSLYPSIIRTFHVDPLALVLAAEEPDPIPGFLEGRFSRSHSILPGIIEFLWQARDRAKQEGNAPLSQAIKIIMNSFYGVLGTPGCRFFDPRLVSSITLRGHEILKTTRDLIEAEGYRVIYGDTDSVFVLLPETVSAEGADAAGKALMNHLNQWWRDHLAREPGIRSCLEVEYETHFERFLMPRVRGSEKGSKKRYAGLIRRGGEHALVFKGLETVRSDWSQLAREFQQALYERIFLDQPCEDLVRETVDDVLAGRCDDRLVLRKRLRRKLDDYQKNIPPHVRAARMAETERRARGLESRFAGGGWIEYVMTVNGPEPLAYTTSRPDYEFYIERQLAPIADAILSFRSTSLRELTDRQLGLF
ncbi:MAG: DNA polymerase II [Pseudomonadota bacterium]